MPSNTLIFTTVAANTMLLTFFLVLVLPGTMLVGAAGRPLVEESSAPNKSMTYAVFKPPAAVGAGVFHSGREVNGCLPKGFHRNSAPSRYINYEPLGTTTIMCDPVKH